MGYTMPPQNKTRATVIADAMDLRNVKKYGHFHAHDGNRIGQMSREVSAIFPTLNWIGLNTLPPRKQRNRNRA